MYLYVLFFYSIAFKTSVTVKVDVTIKTREESEVGKTSFTYFLTEYDAAIDVIAKKLRRWECNEQPANPAREESSAISPSLGGYNFWFICSQVVL